MANTANEKLMNALERLKIAKDQLNMPKHEAWVPFPEKELAKSLGVRWNSAAKIFEFAAADPNNHPCSRYLPSNFMPLKDQLPYDEKQSFKELGVVTVPVDGKWTSFVMTDSKYEDLIVGLVELELI